MKTRHPIWNILFILGVLYVLVFGFLYVYMQREPVSGQVQDSAEENEVLAREVDILDAPLTVETSDPDTATTDEAQPSRDPNQTDPVQATAQPDAAQALSTPTDTVAADSSDAEVPDAEVPDAEVLDADTLVTAEAETPTDDTLSERGESLETDALDVEVAADAQAASSETPETLLSEVPGEPEDSDAQDSNAQDSNVQGSNAQGSNAQGSNVQSSNALNSDAQGEPEASTDADAEVQDAPLGTSDPYRYNLNEMASNSKLETEQGWVTFEGTVDSPQPSQRYFLIVQSLVREPPTLFSQGELKLAEDGSFEARAKYATFSEFYKTYIIATSDNQAARKFSAEGSSSGLPSGFRALRPEIEVLVD